MPLPVGTSAPPSPVDRRVTTFDLPHRSLPWREFFLHLAMRFRSLTLYVAPVHVDYNGGGYSSSGQIQLVAPCALTHFLPLLGHRHCPLVHSKWLVLLSLS